MVTAHTERFADELKHRFKDDPAQELAVWMRAAHQREAMVTSIYSLPELRRRIPNETESGAAGVAAKAVKGIWVQEEGHTQLLGAVRVVAGDPAPILQEIQGRFEGDVTRAGCSGSLLARLLVAVGSFFDVVPAFAKEINEMSLRQFYEFCAELEDTASQGYTRMVALSDTLARLGIDDNPIFPLPYELTRVLLEERYHASILRHIIHWLDEDERSFRNLPAKDCVVELHTLANKHLHTFKARLTRSKACGEPAQISGPPPTMQEWVSDGGLGGLFAEFGLSVPIVEMRE